MGRFQQEDPIKARNQFAYAKNDPLLYGDQNGLWPTKRVGPFGGTVHQNSIERVLGSLLTRDEIEILKAWQVVIDNRTQNVQAMHAMRDRRRDSKVNACVSSSALFRHFMAEARATASLTDALIPLAFAMHIAQDATSPAHEDFENWYDTDVVGLIGKVSHVLTENFDPGAGSHLDDATRIVWQIYKGELDEPEDVFMLLGVDHGKANP